MSQAFDQAILYWFYKDIEVTKNHLEIVRKNNPNCKIYGLFGGDPLDENVFKEELKGLLDDFWTYPGTYGAEAKDKWLHGDLLILDWYDRRGRDLIWDSVAIVQWDMLTFDSVDNVVPGLKKNEIFFSGYRDLDEELENRWSWTTPDKHLRADFLDFKEFVANEYGYKQKLKACLFIYAVFPRAFLDKYLQIESKTIGFLEYKLPTLATIWGIDVYEHDLGVFWRDERDDIAKSPLNATKEMITDDYVISQLKLEDGWRIFHPYEQVWERTDEV